MTDILVRLSESQLARVLATVVVILVAWQASVALFDIPAYVLPSAWTVGKALFLHPGLFLSEASVTLRELLLGFTVAVVIAVPLALFMAYSRHLEGIISPFVVVSQAVPKIALAPLLLVWFGFGEMPKVIMAALIAFFPMLISTLTGFKAIEPDVLSLARSMGAPGWKVFWKIRLPSAMPTIFGGLKLAITFSLIGAVIGEFLAGDKGIGYLIQSASGAQRMDILFAAVIVTSLMSLVLYYLVELVEHRVTFWHPSQSIVTA